MTIIIIIIIITSVEFIEGETIQDYAGVLGGTASKRQKGTSLPQKCPGCTPGGFLVVRHAGNHDLRAWGQAAGGQET